MKHASSTGVGKAGLPHLPGRGERLPSAAVRSALPHIDGSGMPMGYEGCQLRATWF